LGETAIEIPEDLVAVVTKVTTETHEVGKVVPKVHKMAVVLDILETEAPDQITRAHIEVVVSGPDLAVNKLIPIYISIKP
jgi:hypothetical protein